jgi:acyl-CoA reductase-like NAD-dependent aldehyde dehydrogenase/ABC-type branched-subunit amino acid transport system ATPase component
MLEVEALSVSYGKHMALAKATLTARPGEIVVILGANGAGKTTLLKSLAGMVAKEAGSRVRFNGADIAAMRPHRIVETGLALVPEGRGIFGDLTVRENLELGAFARRARQNEKARLDRVLSLFPRLAERMQQTARTMSGGEQQMLAIGRALMSKPDILLLDEPSLGLAPIVTQELFRVLARIREDGTGILLVEQNTKKSLEIADRGYLLDNGRITGEGAARSLQDNPAVQAAYLGISATALPDAGTGFGANSAEYGEPPSPGSAPPSRPLPPGERADSRHPPSKMSAQMLAADLPSPLAGEGGARSAPGEGGHPQSQHSAKGSPLSGRRDVGHFDEISHGRTDAMFDIQLLIDNEDREASGGASFSRLNPLTRTEATKAAAATAADARAAASAAAAAFPAWSKTGPGQRRALLLKAADLLEARTPDFIERGTRETGATALWIGFNVHLAASMLREAAGMTTQIAGEVIPSDVPGSFAMAIRQPVGVILAIAPWNAPVILGVRSIAMPLACGNTVVLKASELCPATHHLIGEVLKQAGLPAGVVNIITNAPDDAPEIVEALIAHPAVRRVNFTGSTRVGRIIAQTAAPYLKPVLLELGGKAPMIVLDDADLDAAVDAAAFGAFMNQGQICMSTERLVVDHKIADAFVAKLAAKASSLPAGDPSTGNVVIGSVVNAEAVKRLSELLADAQAKGAKVAAGAGIEGTIMQATVLDHVDSSMRIYGEESFGPVVSVVRVDGDEEAIRVANDTEYGLSACVFSRDISRAMGVAQRIESGICHINGPTVHDEAQMPFGGVKASGYGRFGGKAAISEFTELRWITIQNGPRHYPF